MDFFKRYLQAVYAVWAKVYDGFLDKLFKFDRQKVIATLNVKKTDRILEVGVGTGLNLPFYPNCTVHGIDFSNAMLVQAKKKKTKAKIIFRKMDASQMSFPDNHFDKVVMTFVLRVTPEPRRVLNEVARVLNSKGTVVILDQFKTGFSILQPFMVFLGWGKQHDLDELLKGLPFRIQSKRQFGKTKGTQLIVLEK